MRRSESELVFFATDLSNHLACPHLSLLNRSVVLGERGRPRTYEDPAGEALRQRGLEHEARVLASFVDRGLAVEAMPEVRLEGDGDAEWTDGASRTADAMRRGVDVIYQGRFYGGGWGGSPDFLIRVDAPSELGEWSYEIVDAKLSREAKGGAVLQVSLYSHLLAGVQGLAPEYMHLALGRSPGDLETFRVDEYSAYYRATRTRFEALVADRDALTYPEPVEHCRICRWSEECSERRREDDHLSLVAGISRNQRARLVDRRIGTLADLAAADLPLRPALDRVSDASYERVREQARVQIRGRESGTPYHELLIPFTEGEGLAALPEPCRGDLFFDIEGAPYALGDGLEYLFGLVDVEGVYAGTWALDRVAEKAMFEEFVDRVMARVQEFPGAHVYHYAPYEKTAIKKLAGRHATREDEVDELLRGEVFVDLYRVVRQGLRASVESYSIKKMEPFYRFDRDADLRAATGALASFEAWLELGGREGKAGGELMELVEIYNRDDCLSTLRLRDWLEGLRDDAQTLAGAPVPRPPVISRDASEEVADIGERVAEVFARLVRDVPEREEERDPEQRALWLLAHLLEFHRREDKSMWWEYFDRCDLSAEELIEHRATLGGLEALGVQGKVKKSLIHGYRFPEQEHDLEHGDNPHDPETKRPAGRVYDIDEEANQVFLIRGVKSAVPDPEALVPVDNIRDAVMRDSLLRLGDALASTGCDGAGDRQNAADLLMRSLPRAGQADGEALLAPAEDRLDGARRLAIALDRTTLPVQGPPGSGKTYTGARMITALLAAGKRVGITSNSHKVISNLLEAVGEAADEERLRFRGVQKASERQWCGDPRVERADNARVVEALSEGEATLAAGTAWLWSREDLAGSVDVLFIDEAGQVSLANTLAVSQAADSLVLLGDPQQLPQPISGVHPDGAGESALSHVLRGEQTMPPDRGLFLDDTWRMHPSVCAFTSEQFYESKLGARPDLETQIVNGDGPLVGQGLRFIGVEHNGNINASVEEATRIRGLFDELLASRPTWVDRHGIELRLTLDQILVVAPYNAHVAALKAALPDGARVGTVDKFQGQEAPIVVYSMASSTPEDAPRGMEFLYSLNRLNVATSRARCVAAIVASPKLLAPECKTPRQMRLANAFCRFMELAS